MQTTEAMQQRRDAIINAAEILLAHEDLSAFSIRKLASKAGVSVVTVYNLIGDRQAVLFALVNDLTEQMKETVVGVDESSILSFVGDRQRRLLDFVEIRPNLLRAANLAFDQLSHDPHWRTETRKITRNNEKLHIKAIMRGVDSGELRGEIPPELLSEQLYRSYIDATMDWAYRRISIKTYRKSTLRNSFIVLLADATEQYRTQILADLQRL